MSIQGAWPAVIKRTVLTILAWGRQLYWRWRAPLILGVRGLILHQGHVLLVRHDYGNRQLWHLPGGAVKRKETLIEALHREVEEELKAELQVERLLGVYTNFSQGASDHIVVFIASLKDPARLKPGWEIEAFALFDPDALPESTSPATRRRVQEYLQNAGGAQYRRW